MPAVEQKHAAMAMIATELRQQARALCTANDLHDVSALLTVLGNAYCTEVALIVLNGDLPAEAAIAAAKKATEGGILALLKPPKGGH